MCNLYLERFGTPFCAETPLLNDQNDLFQKSWNRVIEGGNLGKNSLPIATKSGKKIFVSSPENNKIIVKPWDNQTSLWIDFSLLAAGALGTGMGIGLRNAPLKVAGWTVAGTGLGGGLGHLACAVLDIEKKRPLCDLMGGLIGGLASGLLAYHFFGDEFDIDIVVFPTIDNENNSNNDNNPSVDPEVRNPIDDFGP